MGKGDKRSKRGKIHIGSYGVTRRKKAAKKVAAKKSATKKAAKA
jgi:ribosomal small subunit protein bTHX